MRQTPGLVLIVLAACGADVGTTSRGVLYGEDGRSEPSDFDDPQVGALVDRAVALIPNERFIDGVLTAPTLAEQMTFCDGERFLEQPSAAVCSGVLLDATTVLTAGHCVPDAERCEALSFVLGYTIDGTADRYTCAALLAVSRRPVDYALVRLDRPAPIGEPMILADVVEVGEQLWTVGTPLGVPIKIDRTGRVEATTSDETFTAALDVYEGSSGSAVYDSSFSLAGIAVRGRGDFGFDLGRDCFRSLTATVGEEVVTYARVAQVTPTVDTGCTCVTRSTAPSWWLVVLLVFLACRLRTRPGPVIEAAL